MQEDWKTPKEEGRGPNLLQVLQELFVPHWQAVEEALQGEGGALLTRTLGHTRDNTI